MAAATGDGVTSAAAAAVAGQAPLPFIGPAPAPGIPVQYLYKNRLQEFAQRAQQKLPIYNVEVEGEHHQPKFKCTVEVCGQQFSSTQSFSRRKEAEQDAARVAYEALVTKDMGDVNGVLELIGQDMVFCKSILHEFAVKTKTSRPSYSVVPEVKPMTQFVASVMFDGNTYTGEPASCKKDAEKKAARVAVKSILATGDTCMMKIIRSKEKLITAIKSSRSGKDTGVGTQHIRNISTKTLPFTPIKFTRPAADTGSGEKDHVAPESQDQYSLSRTVAPSVNSSSPAVTPSRKRKGRGGGSGVN